MSESAIRRYYETVDGPDPLAVVDLFTPDAAYRRPGYPPMVGHDALRRFYGGERVIVEGRHTIERLICPDQTTAAVAGRFDGRLNDGRDVSIGFADFFTLRDELIAERATYFDTPAV